MNFVTETTPSEELVNYVVSMTEEEIEKLFDRIADTDEE